MSKAKRTASRDPIASPPRIQPALRALFRDADGLPPDFPLTVWPDDDLCEATPIVNGFRMRCRSCGAVQDIQIIADVGVLVPRLQHIYADDGRLRYRTLAHAHPGCPALTSIDKAARLHEPITQGRVPGELERVGHRLASHELMTLPAKENIRG